LVNGKEIKTSKDPVKPAHNVLQHIIDKTESEIKAPKKKIVKIK
jgi:hypothetical protein